VSSSLLSEPPQNEDGNPHFSYFDKEWQLSFVWGGDSSDFIEVSHGGYGEPVTDTIDPISYLPDLRARYGPRAWLLWFASVCEIYIIRKIQEGVLKH
jgi:hypothetical protein